MDLSLPPVLPVGTQVVVGRTLARGDASAHAPHSVAVIINAPVDADHAYRVRFNDQTEASVHRSDFAVLSVYQSRHNSAANQDWMPYVVYRCVMGSRAYGLDDDQSDTDRRGIYLPPADLHWSLYGVPEQLENDATQEVYWEFQKFILLALKANPNVLECLYTPLIEYANPIARQLLSCRSIFLSKLVYQTYNGYVLSQWKKLQSDLRQQGKVKPKHLMHLIRLLLAGIGTMRDGVVPVRVEQHRDRLRAIKAGDFSFDEVETWRLRLHVEFETAYEQTRLPDRPDYAAANAVLIEGRRSMLG